MHLKIISDHDRIWLVRLVKKGKRYGATSRMIHDQDDPLVEFYDPRFEHCEYGQFVSRYLLSSLQDHQLKHPGRGLNVEGGVHEWEIGGEALERTIRWAENKGAAPTSRTA